MFAIWEMVAILVGWYSCLMYVQVWMGTTQRSFNSILFFSLNSKFAFLHKKKVHNFNHEIWRFHITFEYLLTSISDFTVGKLHNKINIYLRGSLSFWRIGLMTSSKAIFCVIKSLVVASLVLSTHSAFSLHVLVIIFLKRTRKSLLLVV